MDNFMFFKRQGFRLFSVFTVLAVFFCTLAGYKTFVSADVYVPSNIKGCFTARRLKRL